ncbi:MAG: SMP-30/gluconolactonase/LRE family protein [Planctomycetaceae bacterium]
MTRTRLLRIEDKLFWRNNVKSIHSLLSAAALLLAATAPVPAAELSDLVAGDVTHVVGDCKFTEGPAWHPAGYLLFTDIPNNRILKVEPDGSHSVWMEETGGANGLICDLDGNIYAAQGGAKQVGRLVANSAGQGELAAALTGQFDGKPLNRPNDLALDASGGLYFSDPNYGQDPATQPVEGVYYISAEGKLSRVIADLPRPNGVLVSADGKTLFVAHTANREILAYQIVAPGQLSEPQVIFAGEEELDGHGPDGMALDEHGNIYATYKQLVIVAPQGELIARVAIPEKPSNVTFGGPENRTLYITARTGLYQMPMKVAGIALRKTGPQQAATSGDASTPPPAAETVAIKFDGLTLNVPKGWEQQKSTSQLRLGQFAIPAVEGDTEPAELAVFPPFGGSVEQNVARWIGQFEGQGRTVKTTQGEGATGKYVFVELAGTYKKSVGPPILQRTEAKSGYKMLGVMLLTKEGNYFLKLTGEAKTVDSAATALRQSFGGDAAKSRITPSSSSPESLTEPRRSSFRCRAARVHPRGDDAITNSTRWIVRLPVAGGGRVGG